MGQGKGGLDIPDSNWESISREVVSIFTALTDQTPVYIICLDWNLVCDDFEDEDGWTKWSNDGSSLRVEMEQSRASFIIFSRSGMHELVYNLDKKPEIKHVLDLDELPKFKLIKSRHDRIELQIEREKDFIIGKMKFMDSHKFKFNNTQWSYLRLRKKIIVGKKRVEKLITAKKTSQSQGSKIKESKASVPTSQQNLDTIRSQFQVPIVKPTEIISDDYDESILSAKEDIKALKKPENRKLANNALSRMETAADIIKRSDRDVTKRNKRVKKLTHERIQIKNRSLRKLVKKTKINELERKIEMIDRMNEKELAVKTQKVTEFCGLREAILTIMTNEEKLKPEDINLLIENAMHSEPKTERKKTPRKPKHHQSARPQLKDINKLVDSGNKKQWKRYITNNIKNKIKMKFPQLEPAKYKISDYGYRQFIELIIESPDFLRLISEVRDVSGFDVVRLNYLMRGDDPTLRGVEALCTLLINKEIRYDPVSETDFKYLNIIFHSFSLPKKEGINKTWNIKTENKKIQITAIFNKEDREWIYTLVQS